MPARVRRIRLMNRPSTLRREPTMMIQAMPARERRPSSKESKSISRSKRAPRDFREMQCRLAKSASRPSRTRSWRYNRKSGGPSRLRVITTAALRKTRLGAGLEDYVDGLAVFCGQRYFLILLSEFFVHEGDGVVAGRQALDLELAVGAADRIERILDYVYEHAHPGMLVAFNRQQDFFAGEGLFDGWSLRGLRFIPLAIVLGSGVNVVGGGIAVDNLDGLTSHHAKDVGFIFAAALRQT